MMVETMITAQKKYSIEDFFSKCSAIRRKLQFWSNLPRISLMENFIFCAVDGLQNSNKEERKKSNKAINNLNPKMLAVNWFGHALVMKNTLNNTKKICNLIKKSLNLMLCEQRKRNPKQKPNMKNNGVISIVNTVKNTILDIYLNRETD